MRAGHSAFATSIRVQITVRRDDEGILLDISKRLGGKVYRVGGCRHRKPMSVWRTRNADAVRVVCRILKGGTLPSKKRKEVDLMEKFLDLPRIPRRKIDKAAKALSLKIREHLHLEIKRLHGYNGRINRKLERATRINGSLAYRHIVK